MSTDAPAQPVLLLLKGPPGSGKSTLAAALARTLRWPLIDKDDARSPFQPLAAAHPGLDWNELSYSVMWRVAEAQLRCGLSAIVDCPLARRSLFDRAAALAAQHGAQLALVELEPRDAATWRRRVELRGAAEAGTDQAHKPGSWADIHVIAARNGGTEAWSEGVGGQVALHCRLDSTAADTAAQLQAVLQELRARGVPLPVPGLDLDTAVAAAGPEVRPAGADGSAIMPAPASAPTAPMEAAAAAAAVAAAAAQAASAAAAQAAKAALQASPAAAAAQTGKPAG